MDEKKMKLPPHRKSLALFGASLAISGCVSLTSPPPPTLIVEIADFTTDGCSLFPDGKASQPTLWQHCCVAHDQAYWPGGTKEERAAADDALKTCVAATDSKITSAFMWLGVRVAGGPQWPTKFRWGYGWPYLRPYQSLDANEQQSVKKKWEQHLQKVATAAPKP